MRLIDVTDLEKFIQENVCAIGNDHLMAYDEAIKIVKAGVKNEN